MSNVDINVNRRTDGRTDGQKIRRLYRTLLQAGAIKIKTFQVFDIDWLYRTSRDAIVKADVTESKEVTKRQGIVITIWQMSTIKVTAL